MVNRQRLYQTPTHPDNNGWIEQHMNAVTYPHGSETGIVGMLHAWLQYADVHAGHFQSKIGEDGVLGPEWARIGAAIRGLLNGSTGRLDCGTLDGIICDTLTREGFDPDLI